MKKNWKKIIISSLSIISFLVISCASNNVESVDELNNSLNDSENIDSNTEKNIEENTEQSVLQEELKSEDSLFPIPEVLEEPEIITLEPEDIVEQIPESPIEEIQKEDEIEPELIEFEEPLPLEEIQEQISDVLTENKEEKEDEIDLYEDEKPSVKDENNILEKDDNKNKTENFENNASKEDTTVLAEEEKPVEIEDENNEEVVAIVDDESENTEINDEENNIEEAIIPSRSVTLKRKEFVDITYPGTGWIYMGATDGSKNLSYFGRALGTKDTTFSLQARYAGKNILHFYKNDHLTNEYLDDYIEIIIIDETGSNKTHIAAPEYKLPVPEKAKELFYNQKSELETISNQNETDSHYEKNIQNEKEPKKTNENYKEIKTVEKEEEKMIEKIELPDPETLLKEANLLYNEREFKSAYEKIEQFLNTAAKKIDEGLFLKGKILEAKSEIQNIKNAIKAYEKVTKEYPASQYWNDANKRIVYLKRFYLEVR